MSEILIVSKTRMRSLCCVGALDLMNNQSLRLLQANGYNQPTDCLYKVGQIWDCKYSKSLQVTSPHNEDVLVQSSHFIRNQTHLSSFIQDKSQVWKGHPSRLFDGLLSSTMSRKRYISKRKRLPSVSTGYWLPDKDLHLVDDDTYEYRQFRFSIFKIKYVGLDDLIDPIPAETLVRVSLARWWVPKNSNIEERCYLQLSGWYL